MRVHWSKFYEGNEWNKEAAQIVTNGSGLQEKIIGQHIPMGVGREMHLQIEEAIKFAYVRGREEERNRCLDLIGEDHVLEMSEEEIDGITREKLLEYAATVLGNAYKRVKNGTNRRPV